MIQEMMSKETDEKESEGTPFDSIIERLKSYVDNPELATKETLQQLLTELEDLKGVVDGEESETPETPETSETSETPKGVKNPSLMIMIGQHKGEGYKGGK